MTNFKKLLISSMAIAMVFVLVGCGGVSEEQMAELEALRVEVKSLEKEVNDMKAEKASLEREIAEKTAKLNQCAKDKAETEKNLETMGQ
ncbi:MAG: hypothetical protein KKA84_08990 [Bacteroidetes bacterium]|nr:hypothetical protein [Bacteroidota bacterium]